MPSPVALTSPASPEETAAHYARKLAVETDCADVHASLSGGYDDFVLLDVRGPRLYEYGHVPGAISLPHGKITTSKLEDYPRQTLFVVYCAGPHCNGADKAALRLARLARPVKIMIGGMTGWADEGFSIAQGMEAGAMASQ